MICSWDPHHNPILAEVAWHGALRGPHRGQDLQDRASTRAPTVQRMMIIEHKGDLHPQVILEDETGNRAAIHPLPEKAYIEVRERRVKAVARATLLAKTPREIQGTQDITGGLPRITELFEARRPKDATVIAEIDGMRRAG